MPRVRRITSAPCPPKVEANFAEQVATRWAPTIYKWSYKPYKWPYKWVTGVITLLIGVITPFITSRGPTLYNLYLSYSK